jgi:pimeloyl-ACP methyl ester carboxylesterase
MGTSNSRHLHGPNVADAARRGLRLISYDRPGYGGSTPHPGHSAADCAGDVRAICAALGIGRLAMWGISGGGPYLLACAALLPDLVVAAASLASLAPYGAAHIRPWGFELADISVPVLLLHGRQDQFVPFGHGQWLAAHIAGVEARLLDGDGHLTLLEHRVSEVHAWLSEHL